MTKREYQNYSRLFFFFSAVFFGFLINALVAADGLKRIVSASLFGFLIIMQLRIALAMRRKAQGIDLK